MSAHPLFLLPSVIEIWKSVGVTGLNAQPHEDTVQFGGVLKDNFLVPGRPSQIREKQKQSSLKRHAKLVYALLVVNIEAAGVRPTHCLEWKEMTMGEEKLSNGRFEILKPDLLPRDNNGLGVDGRDVGLTVGMF